METGTPFITISRQTGAGGNSLARQLLETMREEREPLFHGWGYYDREICQRVVELPGIRMPLPKMLEKEYRSRTEDLLLRLTDTTPQETVLSEIFGLVRRLATGGKAIIVGRGGACVTRGYPGGVHIRLVAPFETRVRRMMRILNADAEAAGRTVREQDKARAALVRQCFHADIEDPLLYDAVWNTGTTPLADIALSTLALTRTRAAEGVIGGSAAAG